MFRPLDLVIMQQFFTGIQDWGHLVKERCTTTTLSDDDKSRYLTSCYWLKHQSLFKSFLNALCKLHYLEACYENILPHHFKFSFSCDTTYNIRMKIVLDQTSIVGGGGGVLCPPALW